MASNGLTIDDLQIKIAVNSAEAVKNLNELGEQLKKLGTFKASGLKKLAQNIQDLNTVSGSVKTAARDIEEVGDAATNTAKTVSGFGSKFSSTLKNIVQYTEAYGGSIAKNFITAPFRIVGTAVSNLTSRLKDLGRMIKRVAIYRLIRSGIRAITQALKEGVSMLVEWDRTYGNNTSRAAKTTDEIAAKWREVKKSLGAAAMPLIQIVQPALMAVMNSVIAIANTVNQFLRSLQGYSTYMKATEKDWKKSVGSAKELKRILFGFDELNVLPSPNGGGGDAGIGALDFYETDIDLSFVKTLGDTISGVIDNIKNRWEDLKFNISNGGSVIGSVLGFIYGVFQDLGVGVGNIFKDIGDGIRGFVKNLGIEGTAIGNTLGTIGDLFSDLGDLIIGIFTFDLPKIVNSLGNILGDIFRLADNLLDDIWHGIDTFLVDLGDRLGVDLSSIRNNVAWLFSAIRVVLGVGLPAILGTLAGWAADILKLFAGVFGSNGLIKVINGIIEFIAGVFTLDWKRAWEGVVTVFKGIGNVLISVVEFLVNAFITPFQAVAKAINNFKISIPEWIPLVGGKSWNPSIAVPQKVSIPRFAEGGFIPNTGSLFWAGDGTPEIVAHAPNGTEVMNSSQIEQAMANANAEVINAIYSMANMIVGAVNNKDFDVYMDAQKVGKSVTQYQLNFAKQYGG